ncbi:MAG: hypothetical protein ACLQEQ_05995 [Nitrososphaerales archaeon]
MKKGIGRIPRREVKDEGGVITRLGTEVGLSREEAAYYLKVIRDGSAEASTDTELSERLSRRGMVILSGDGKRILPVHPRLGLANHYRTWREGMVREINERRMRIDRLILELIPVYEAATEKKADAEGR